MSNLALPKFRIQDASGTAIPNGKLYFYAPGTTTAKDTYSNSALSSTNANPVVAGSDGWCGPIYLAAEPYKIVAKDAAGTTLWTVDNHDPSVSTGLSELDIESAGTDPTVSAENTSSGPAVKAVNSGSGHGAWIEADTSTPVKAALHVVAQDEFPSSPAVGDIVVSSVTKRASLYDGTSESRIGSTLGASYAGVSGQAIGASTVLATRTIPANSLRAGSVIRVVAGPEISSASGSPTVTVYLEVEGTTVAAVSKTSATGSGESCFLTATIAIKAIGAAGSFASAASGAFDGDPPDTLSHVDVLIDTTSTIDITVVGSTAGTAEMDLGIFDVEIA